MADDVAMSVKGVDFNAKSKTTLVFFPNATTLAAVQAYATAFAPLYEAIVEAKITEMNVNFPLTVPNGKANPGAGVRINEGADFSYDTPGRYNFGLWVPAIKLAKLSGDTINAADADIIAFNNAIVGGLGGTLPTDGYGLDVNLFLKGRFAYRK